jgi:hypothetical protein
MDSPSPAKSDANDSRPFPSVAVVSGSTTTILRSACAALFLGRAWQHLFIGTPYRPILYSQSLMEGFVLRVFGLDWTTWATSPVVEANLKLATQGIGVFFVFCAVAAVLVSPRRIRAQLCLAAGAILLSVIAFAVYRDKMLRLVEFFELACMVSAPLALLVAARCQDGRETLLRLGLPVVLAATFAGHGLYAVGYYQVPGEWVTMVMTILRVTEPAAFSILFAAGLLDFFVAIGIFVPGLRTASAIYAAVWGLLTALARTLANVTFENFQESAFFWIPETLVRLPNGLIPLVIAGWLLRARRAAPASRPDPSPETPVTAFPPQPTS